MRRRLVVIAAVTLAAALIPVTALFYLALSRSLERDTHTLLQARAEAVIAGLDVTSGRIVPRETRGEAVLDSSTWVIDAAGRPVERPAPSDVDRAVEALARVRGPTRQNVGDLALLAVPLRGRHARVGTVVASVSRLPYEHAERTALTAAVTLDLVVLLAAGGLIWRSVSAALAPVARMTASAAVWGAHHTRQRFDLGPPVDELTGLAATLDELLDRLAASLGHERRLTAEIAHELRTPLARIRAEAEVALRAPPSVRRLREVLGDVVTDTEDLSRAIDALLRAAADPQGPDFSARCDALAAIDHAVRQGGIPHSRLAIDDDAGPLDLAVEPDLAVRALIPLLDNALKYGTDLIRVRVHQEARSGVIDIVDDGPGIAARDVLTAFEPGARGSASAGTFGAGLGLPLARRLARAAGGDVAIHATEGGGHVTLTFPLVAGHRYRPATPKSPPRGRFHAVRSLSGRA